MPFVFHANWIAPLPIAGSFGSSANGELKSVQVSQEPWKSSVSRLIQSTVSPTLASSQLPSEFTFPAGRSAVSRYCLPVTAP